MGAGETDGRRPRHVAGTADDDDSPGVDFITFELSPSGNLTNVPVVPTDDVMIPSSGGTTSGCESGTFLRRQTARSR